MSTLAWILVAFGVWVIALLFAYSLCEAAKRADTMIERWFKITGLTVLVILFFPIHAMCAPNLICDPQAGVQYYTISGDPYWTANIPAQADGSLKTDLAGIPVGSHSLQVRACEELWGCSDPSPFSFSRPQRLSPSALTITK